MHGGGGTAARHVSVLRSRYEDLVSDFGPWLDQLIASLSQSYTPHSLARLREELLQRHGRASFTANGRHRRSVVPGRYAAEVDAAAARSQRHVHRELWELLGYE